MTEVGAGGSDGARTAVVVDDDADVRLILGVALAASGFAVHEARTGPDGVELIRRVRPDLVTLEKNLPGIDGLEACRQLRDFTDAYVVMITSSLDEADRLLGLAVGADDYVTKPFSPREVQARVEAMFRRPRIPQPRPPAEADRFLLRHEQLVVDAEGRTAWLDGVELPLTRTEFDLLATMIGNPRRVWRRDTLLDEIWGGKWSEHHVVEVHVGNLRRKLEHARPGGAQLVKTVRGVGYRLTPATLHAPPSG